MNIIEDDEIDELKNSQKERHQGSNGVWTLSFDGSKTKKEARARFKLVIPIGATYFDALISRLVVCY